MNMKTNAACAAEAAGLNPSYAPRTASAFLEQADRTLGERGKQYDKNGEQERSMGRTVAAFNAVTGLKLTEQQGWAFMLTLKLVRGADKPHADSALDAVAYSALYAESVQAALDKQGVTALMKQIRAGYKGCPRCGADVDKEAGSCHNCSYGFEDKWPPEAVSITPISTTETLLAAMTKRADALETKLCSSEKALRTVSDARNEEIERNKQLRLRSKELHTDLSQALKELADIRARCAARGEELERVRNKYDRLLNLVNQIDRQAKVCRTYAGQTRCNP